MMIIPGTEGSPPCMMCGAEEPHDDTRTVRFGMTCKGTGATPEESVAFRSEFTFRTEVAAAYGETIATSDEFMEHLARRNKEADERVLAGQKWTLEHPDEPHKNPLRSDVSAEALQAHATTMAREVYSKVNRDANLRPQEFEVQPPMIRVPQKDLSRRGSRLDLPDKDTKHLITGTRQHRIQHPYLPPQGANGEREVTTKEIKDAAEIPDSALFLNSDE